MKIIAQDTSKLVIKEDRPQIQWVMLGIAIVLMTAGLLTSFLSPVNVKYICDKKTSSCTLSKYYVLKNPEIETLKFDEIEKVTYKLYTSQGSTSCYVYFLSKGKKYVIENCSDSNDGEIKAAQIDNFIKDPQQPELSSAQDNTIIGFIFIFGMIILAGILLIRFIQAKFLISVLDKANNQVNSIERNMLAKNINTYKLDDIVKVSIVNVNKHKDKGNVSSGNTRLELVTKSGEYIPMSLHFTEGDKDKKDIAKSIRSFLSLK